MDSVLDYDTSLTRSPWTDAGRAATLGIVSAAAKVVMRVFNTFNVEGDGAERFRALALEREPGVGLVTYSNHTSTFDDPGIPSAMLPWWAFWGDPMHNKMRWTMCAADVCFVSDLLRDFFASGKTLPIDRAGGVYQPVLGTAGRIVGSGGWLHVFPEGRVRPAGDIGPFRQGIGKVICDAHAAAGGRDPLIVPVFHSGMGRVMPYYESWPRGGNEIHVVVGEPVDLSAVTCRCNVPGEDQAEVWRDIAAVLRESLMQLQDRAPPNVNQLEERPGLAEEIMTRANAGTAVPVADRNPAGCTYSTQDQQQQQQQQQQQKSHDVAASWRERGGFVSAATPQFLYSSVLQSPVWAADQDRRQARGGPTSAEGVVPESEEAAADAADVPPAGWLGLRRRRLLSLLRRRAAPLEQQQSADVSVQQQSKGEQPQQLRRPWWRWRRVQHNGEVASSGVLRTTSASGATANSGGDTAATGAAASGWGRRVVGVA